MADEEAPPPTGSSSTSPADSTSKAASSDGDPQQSTRPVRRAARKRVVKTIFEPEAPTPVPRKKRPKPPPPPPREDAPSPSPEPETPSSFPSPDDNLDTTLDIAGVYAPLLRLRHKRQLDSTPLVPLPPRTIGGVRDQLEKTKQCNCKRSNCLKLYCDCFQSGIHCNPLCNCVSCKNLPEFAHQRNLAIDVTLLRNPNSFRPRLMGMDPSSPSPQKSATPATPTRHGLTGCNCKKSFCLKKYCECFHGAVYCSSVLCRCTNCQNREGNPERERLIGKRRNQAEVAAAAAALAHQHSRLSGRMAMMGEAGRAYYHEQQGSVVQEKDVEATTAAAAVAAGAAADGVDLFLPPSSYTVPMALQGGTPYAALAFGKAGPKQEGEKMATKRARRKQAGFVAARYVKWETELQRLWRIETERAQRTLYTAKMELLKSNGGTPPPHYVAESDPVIKFRAQAAMESVQDDLQQILAQVQKAETSAIRYMDVEEEKIDNRIPYLGSKHSIENEEAIDESPENPTSNKDILPVMDVSAHAETPDDENKDQPEGGEALANQKDEQETGPLAEVSTSPQMLASDHPGPSRERGSDDSPTSTSNDQAMDEADASGTAEKTATSYPQASSRATSPSEVLDDSLLACNEELEHLDGHTLSEDALRQLTIVAAQDTALLRELARIIRRKTLDLTKERIRLVTIGQKDLKATH